MKLSVSLPEDDVEFLDAFAEAQGIESRSAVVHRAIHLLRTTQLGRAYAEAWDEWENSDEASVWESVVGDGLEPS